MKISAQDIIDWLIIKNIPYQPNVNIVGNLYYLWTVMNIDLNEGHSFGGTSVYLSLIKLIVKE